MANLSPNRSTIIMNINVPNKLIKRQGLGDYI